MAELATADGVTLLDTTSEEVQEEVDYQHFETAEEITVSLGETAGNDVTTEARYFVAASISTETGEMERAMGAPDVINDARVFVSNEDGELGAQFIAVEAERDDDGNITESVGVQDALDEFEEQYL